MVIAATGPRVRVPALVLTAVLGAAAVGQLPAVAAEAPRAPAAATATATLGAAPAAPLSWQPLSRRPGALPAPPPLRLVPVGPLRIGPALPAGASTTTRPPAPTPTPAPARPQAASRSSARTTALCAGRGWQARRGAAVLATLKGGGGRAGYRISFLPARRGLLGLTYLDERRIEVFVRPCADAASTATLRHAIAHEVGHSHDTAFLSAADRRAWKAARGIAASTPWYGCNGCADLATPAGDFAEVYGQWARGAGSNRSRLAGDVPPAELRRLAARFFVA